MRILFLLLLFFRTPSADTVFICTGPSAYAWHSSQSCSGLKRCSAEIITLTKAEAESRGRTPCQKCAAGSIMPSKAKAAAQVSDGQCSATTKKGTRCSRRARSGGYCWQHGG